MSTISVNNLVNVFASPTSLTVGTQTSDPLLLQTNGVLAVTIDANQNVLLSGTGFLAIPKGTTAQRPAVPGQAYMRFNSSLTALEVYDGTSWTSASVGFTTGTGAPTGSVPTSPPFYVDGAATPKVLYFYVGGAWSPVSTPVASQAAAGISRFATTAEAAAETSSTLAISPATLKSSINSNPIGVLSTSAAFTGVSQLDCVRFSAGTYIRAQAGASPSNLAAGFADVTNNTLITFGLLGGFTGLTTDSAYYLSPTTPGGITVTPPTDAIRVGTAMSPTQLFVRIGAVGGGGGSGSTTTLTRPINQTAHGFAVNQWLYAAGSQYALAKADAESTSDVVGFVSAVTDANNFVLTYGGYATGLAGLTPGGHNYLSTTVAGALQGTKTTTSGAIDKPVIAAESATSGYIILLKGTAISGGTATGATGGGADAVFYENSQVITTSYTLSAGKNALTAGPVTANTGTVITIPDNATWSIV